MHVVDASVWVSRFLPGDEHHLASREWLAAGMGHARGLVSPALVLPEVAGAISRRTDSIGLGSKAAKLIESLPGCRLVPVDGPLAEIAAKLAAELHLRGADAVYLAVSYRLGIPLVTWDHEQLARGERVAAVLTPQQALQG